MIKQKLNITPKEFLHCLASVQGMNFSSLRLPEDVNKYTSFEDLSQSICAFNELAVERTPFDIQDLQSRLSPLIVEFDIDNQLMLAVVKNMDEHFVEVFYPSHIEENIEGVFYTIDEFRDLYTGFAFNVIQAPQKTKDTLLEGKVKSGNKPWLWNSFYTMKSELMIVVGAAFMVNLISLTLPLFVMNVYDRVVPNQAEETLTVLTIGILLALIFDFFLKIAKERILCVASHKCEFQLSQNIYKHFLNVRLDAIGSNTSSLTHLLKDQHIIKEFLSNIFIVLFAEIPFIVVFLLFISYLGGSLAWVLILAVPLTIIISLICQIPLGLIAGDAYHSKMVKSTSIAENIASYESMRVQTSHSWLASKWFQMGLEEADHIIKHNHYISLARNLNQLVQKLAYVGIIYFGASFVYEQEMTVGALVACTILSGRLFAPLGQISNTLMQVHTVKAIYGALDKFMNFPVSHNVDQKYIQASSLKGDIDLKHVSFTYIGEKVPAINDVSLQIKSGEKVAVVGHNGSGKSTLLKLMAGLYHPSTGQVMLDNIDALYYNPRFLKSHMAYMPQDLNLHQGTLRENITGGAVEIDDQLFLKATQISGANKVADNHPKGYDMDIPVFGRGVSGGHKQSIHLASTLYKNGDVLLLDEPTNALDTRAENHFIKALAKEVKGKTLVVNVHTLNMLSLVDRIIVVKNGAIFADGKKEDVLKLLNKGGL